MAKRKKKRKGTTPEAPTPDPDGSLRTESVGTSLKDLLQGVKAAPERAAKAPPAPRGAKKKAKGAPVLRRSTPAGEPAPPPAPVDRPSSSLRGDDLIAFRDALAGVRPIGQSPNRATGDAPVRRSRPTVPRTAPSDEQARRRLAALVGGAVHFDIEYRDDGRVFGLREGGDPRVLRELTERGAFVEATLDLHGQRAADADRELTRFVRAEHRDGARRLLIVHGKGIHSESGVSVLRDRAIQVLSQGGAAPVVDAFATAAVDRGGLGALMVALRRKGR